MTFEQIKDQDQAYILHTYGRVDAALVKGENARAWDVEGVGLILVFDLFKRHGNHSLKKSWKTI